LGVSASVLARQVAELAASLGMHRDCLGVVRIVRFADEHGQEPVSVGFFVGNLSGIGG
jgi:hypothetical protein